jgi:hypothetical protein
VSRTFIVFHFLPTFHEPFLPFRNSHTWHNIIAVHLLAVKTFYRRFFFFNFTWNFKLMCCLIFILHKSGRATQHGHTQTKLRGKPIDVERRVQSCSIREASKSIAYHPLPTPTGFHGRVHAVMLFYSRTLNPLTVASGELHPPSEQFYFGLHFALTRAIQNTVVSDDS